jgi:hypothetical protein
MHGAIVIGDDEVLTAFYAVHVDPAPRTVAVETSPHAAAIASSRRNPFSVVVSLPIVVSA